MQEYDKHGSKYLKLVRRSTAVSVFAAVKQAADETPSLEEPIA